MKLYEKLYIYCTLFWKTTFLFSTFFNDRIAFCIFCVNFSTWYCEKTRTFAGNLKEDLEN